MSAQEEVIHQLSEVACEIESLDRRRRALLAERNGWIVILVEAGWSYERIGRLAHLTKSSIAKIWGERPES